MSEDAEKGEETKVEDKDETHIELPKKKKSLWWLWVIIAVVIIGGGIGAYAGRGYIKKLLGLEKKTDEKKAEEKATEKPAGIKIVDECLTWVTPQKLADLKLFKAGASPDFPEAYQGTTYYKVADTCDGNEIILALPKMDTMGAYYDFHHFLKKGGTYYWIKENSDAVGGDGQYYARTTTDTDSTYVIKSLQLDKTITKGSTIVTQNASASRDQVFVDSTPAGTKLEETKWGDIYLLKGEDIDKSSGDAKIAQYYILRNDGIKMIYHPEPSFRQDDGTFAVTWSDSAWASEKFSQIKTSGCGGGSGGSFPLVVDTDSLSKKVEVGSKSGNKVYTLIDQTATLTEFAYQAYLMDLVETKATKDAMLADKAILLWKDDYGSWIIYLNEKYQPKAECGKPVIYLYPEKLTEVSVKVGADITKSDPEYGKGWNVLASPSGILNTKFGIRNSLFWEGIGWGKYPAITSGTVVESSKVAQTISSQLSGMGLNTKEIADFNEFWLAKMPTTPYTRLTWLTTEEMNTLAPLAVSPKPDTMIRVFLDFEGLASKANITPQTLPKYQRAGFTLVEWGGLLKTSAE